MTRNIGMARLHNPGADEEGHVYTCGFVSQEAGVVSTRPAGGRCGCSRSSADQQVNTVIICKNRALASKAQHLSFGGGNMGAHSLKHMTGKRDRRPEAKVLDSSSASRFCKLLSRPIAV